MRRTKQGEPWVVYQMTHSKTLTQTNVVCQQDEWDAIQLKNPGSHLLVRSGIIREEEAERLARGTTGDAHRRRAS